MPPSGIAAWGKRTRPRIEHRPSRSSPHYRAVMIVYAVVDDALSPDIPLGVELGLVRREDAERFIEEVRGDDPEVAAKLRVEERELDTGDVN